MGVTTSNPLLATQDLLDEWHQGPAIRTDGDDDGDDDDTPRCDNCEETAEECECYWRVELSRTATVTECTTYTVRRFDDLGELIDRDQAEEEALDVADNLDWTPSDNWDHCDTEIDDVEIDG